jgi:Ser/Thr protein kinase RdoA (MazF antagonist)
VPNQLDELFSPAEWTRIGLDDVRPLAGGHQSRVFAGQLDGRHVVAKLTNEEFVEADRLETRMNMLHGLSQLDPDVIAPLHHRGRSVNRRGGWLIVVFPFADGPPPNTGRRDDVALMGRTLANLHRSMASLGPIDVGPIAALELVERQVVSSEGSAPQLLHGDFSAANLRLRSGRLQILDFDDCGYGPVEFDVANTLYMELFDAVTHNRIGHYTEFRGWFVEAYTSESGIDIGSDTLDEMIALRRDALGYWIEHLDQAPIGIRTSTPEWLEQLRRFVDQV